MTIHQFPSAEQHTSKYFETVIRQALIDSGAPPQAIEEILKWASEKFHKYESPRLYLPANHEDIQKWLAVMLDQKWSLLMELVIEHLLALKVNLPKA